MDRGLIIFMLLGIVGGVVAAVSALLLGWGWLVAILLYCVAGAVFLVSGAVVAVIMAILPARDNREPDGQTSPDSGLVQVLR